MKFNPLRFNTLKSRDMTFGAARFLRTASVRTVATAVAVVAAHWAFSARPTPAADLLETIHGVQSKVVKIHGAGGYRGLEAYQSGFLFSAEGHILTAWSYVLDTDYITVTLDDGRKFEEAKLIGADPRLELAVLKIEGTDLPHFDLAQAATAEPGTRVLALSNMFGVAVGDEDATVQHGIVSVVTRLNARRGVFATPYDGPAYVLDAITNNPGAAGGALVDYQGRLLGMLGKELRHQQTNLWLNFAIPVAELRTTADEIRTGKYVRRSPEEQRNKPERPMTLDLLGIVLVPDVLDRTPAYIDAVLPGSPAAAAGFKPDDLVIFINDRITQSCRAVRAELEFIHQVDPVKITLVRGTQLVETSLKIVGEGAKPPAGPTGATPDPSKTPAGDKP
jgi:S1-C subfamily serine protease